MAFKKNKKNVSENQNLMPSSKSSEERKVISDWGKSSYSYWGKLIFLVFLAITAVASYFTYTYVKEKAEQRFLSQAANIKNSIEKRMKEYEQVLIGGVSFYYASKNNFSRSTWKTYIEKLKLNDSYPGIQGVGFAKYFYKNSLESFIQQVRAEGFYEFKVWPEYPREVYTSIIYLEPFDSRNQRAFGFDMFSEPVRNLAMVRARDSGMPTLSGVVTLKQETETDVQKGFLFYVPVFREGASTIDEQKRRDSIEGFVYSPFRVKDLMQGILWASKIENVSFEIDDTTQKDAKVPVYNHNEFLEKEKSQFIHSEFIEMAGRIWNITTFTLRDFIPLSDAIQPYIIALLGIIIDLLLFFLIHNLTQDKHIAEQTAARINQRLKESEERFSLAVEGSKDGIWDWNITSNTVFFSDRWKTMLGYETKELENNFSQWERLIHPEDRDYAYSSLEKYLKGENEKYEIEVRMLGKDNTYIWILSRGKCLRDKLGQATRMVGEHTDISERKNFEKQLIAAKEEAQRASNIKSEFLANISHEIRTPMNGVIGIIDLLSHTKLDSHQQELLENLHGSANILLNHLTDILDVTKIEADKFNLQNGPVDLSQALDHLSKDFAILSKNKKINFIYKCAHLSHYSICDLSRLRQILMHLVTNAIKFTDHGTVSLEVDLAEDNGTSWLISFRVTDTGIGMAKEVLDNLYQSFYQGDISSSKKYPGTGLGLFITNNIVKKMGGRLFCLSTPEKGTEFTVIISFPKGAPIVLDQVRGEVSVPKKQPHLELEQYDVMQKPMILVVDDNHINQLVLQKILLYLKCDVVLADEGTQALSYLEKNPVDLIFMDIQMPVLDGYQTTLAIRQSLNENLSVVPIIALTATAVQSELDKCLAVGMHDFLTKPVRKEQIKNILQKYLAKDLLKGVS